MAENDTENAIVSAFHLLCRFSAAAYKPQHNIRRHFSVKETNRLNQLPLKIQRRFQDKANLYFWE